MLHECLTGTQPYPGNSAEQQITGHLTLDPPKPSCLNAAIPAAFDDVIARGMATQPTARFSSAGELARAASAAAALRPRTRQFSAQWPNPDGTGHTPYPDCGCFPGVKPGSVAANPRFESVHARLFQ